MEALQPSTFGRRWGRAFSGCKRSVKNTLTVREEMFIEAVSRAKCLSHSFNLVGLIRLGLFNGHVPKMLKRFLRLFNLPESIQ